MNHTNQANNSSSCSHDDQATVDTHHNSLGGTRSVTTASATTTNKEGSGTTGDGSSGEMMMMNDNKKHATSGDQGTITSSSSSSNKYALMIKYHHFDHSLIKGENDTITAIKTKTERINLDFRPISVHLTQLHSTLTSSSCSAEAAVVAEDDGSVIPIVGVFVAGDDNKLHFFVATMQDLKKNLFQQQYESGAEATATTTTTTSEYTSCFQSALCFEMIDPSNIISTSPSNNSEYNNDSSVESVDDNPLMFATPIMTIDTCISEGHGEMMIPSLFSSSSSSSSSPTAPATTRRKDKVNQLAIACYDGVIRILTYTIECTLDANIMIRIGKLQYSTFIVDGPVATLHFHSKATQNSEQMSDCDFSEEKDLFLLAGSLCGLAFLFYEVPPPSTARIDDGNTAEVCSLFEGPVVVVDGLYDADKEGFEDCVTAVHVMRYYDVTILAVGTQGCRLLMFQQQQQQQNRSAENEARKGRDKHKTLLTAEIESKTEEMMHLSTERDRLTNVVSDLRQKLLDVENNDQEEDVLHGDAIIISRSGSGIESDECEDDAVADQVKKDCISIAPKFERLKSIKAEIDDIEQSCLNCTSKISQLQSLIDDLTDKLNEIDLDVPSPLLDSKSVRKLHRYEYLWEHKLPYPIQGIGSAVCTQSGDLECYITTSQTIHIFRLLSSQMVEAAATSLEKKILSFASTAEDGC